MTKYLSFAKFLHSKPYRRKNTYIKYKILKIGQLSKVIGIKYGKKIHSRNIFITTNALLHIQSRRHSILKDIFIPQIQNFIKLPDRIFHNPKKDKGLILYKIYDGQIYLIVLDFVDNRYPRGYYIVTMFVSRERYIRKMEEL